MKVLLVSLALLIASFGAYAACTTSSLSTNDGMVICTTCCFDSVCTTTCS